MEKFEVFSTHPVLVRGVTDSLRDIFVENFHADKVLERRFKQNRKWGSRDRRFIAETVYNMTRFWGLLIFFCDFKNSPDREEDFLLLWLVYEAWKNKRDATAFLNEAFKIAVDPKVIREQVSLAPKDPWTEVAFPPWLYKKFHQQYSEESIPLLQALNEAAPVCLRANGLKTTRHKLKTFLASENVQTRFSDFAKEGLVLEERQNVFVTDAFKKGYFEVQDEASQMVSELLSPKPGERIADMCAGAGGKTLHLAALMENKGTLLACDVSERKLEELKLRARRAGVSNLRIQTIQGTKSVKRMNETCDGVLIDAPCSGTGVIRRNPDTKWKMNEEELSRLKSIQSEIFETYAKLVKKGGRLVYATCSLLKEENEDQVQHFLVKHPEFERSGQPKITRPDTTKTDGFYAQLLIRK